MITGVPLDGGVAVGLAGVAEARVVDDDLGGGVVGLEPVQPQLEAVEVRFDFGVDLAVGERVAEGGAAAGDDVGLAGGVDVLAELGRRPFPLAGPEPGLAEPVDGGVGVVVGDRRRRSCASRRRPWRSRRPTSGSALRSRRTP